MVQKKLLLLSAVAGSLFTSRYAPQLNISSSLVLNTLALFSIQIFALVFWWVIVQPLFLTPLRHLPQPKGANIVAGHFRQIIKAPSGEPQRDWIDEVDNDGILYYRWIFNESRVMPTSPKALAEVLVQKNYEFIKPQRLRDGLGRLLGVGILLAEGDEHKRQRRMLMPAFAFRHVKDLYPIFWSKAREMTNAISASIKENPASASLQMSGWASRATLDIIGVAGMGQDFNAIKDPSDELYQTYRNIFSPGKVARVLQVFAIVAPNWLVRALPLKRNEEVKEAIGTIRKVARNLIRNKREQLEKGGRTDVDILSVAIESGGFTDENLVDQLMTFLAAGHETTASAMTWASYLLCKHPDVQQRLRDEIRSALPSMTTSDEGITSQDIDKLPYLNAVLNETFRVFPPVPLTLRSAAHDTTICGHFIPAGTTIAICPWAINTSKALWGDDAREFKPERWLGPGRANTGGADSNYAITTFLHGPRSCIGKDFAKAEFACLVAALVGRFELELEDLNYVPEIQGGITARPKDGLNVKLREVEGW